MLCRMVISVLHIKADGPVIALNWFVDGGDNSEKFLTMMIVELSVYQRSRTMRFKRYISYLLPYFMCDRFLMLFIM